MEAKFVCNLKKYRVAQELTQEQLADIVGVGREHSAIIILLIGMLVTTYIVGKKHE